MTKIDLEKILLIAFFTVILSLGPGVLFDHRLKHDFPFAYFASDSFQHQVRAEAIKDMGNFRYEATYISKGFENVVGRYPPALYHLAAVFSNAVGIEAYDSIYFIVVFFAVIASLVMYLIIRNLNKTVALLSLPLTLLIFSRPVSTGFLWGHWPSILSQSFMLLLFWSIMRMDLKKSYILIAIILSAIALAHTSELIFALVFMLIFFGIKVVYAGINKRDVKTMTIAFMLTFIVSFYYLVIFLNTWAQGHDFTFHAQPVWNGNPGFYIAGFGLLLIPIIAGIIFSIPKLRGLHASLIVGVAMLFSGFLNYAGFEFRAFQIRFFWPIYLSVFLGFGIYLAFKSITKRWSIVYTSAVLIVLVVLVAGIVKLPDIKQTSTQKIPSIPYLNLDTGSGIMNPFHWKILSWIAENTPNDSEVYFFYGDIYGQDALLRNSKRTHYLVDPEDFIKSLQERKIKREYVTEFPGDSGGGITYRESFFSFKIYSEPLEFHFGPRDICNFDYYILDRVSGQEVLAQYNMLIAQDLLRNNFFGVVFENEVAVILKNDNPGEDCIEERAF